MDDLVCAFFELALTLFFGIREIVAVKFITEKTQNKIGDDQCSSDPNDQFQKAYHRCVFIKTGIYG